MENRTGLRTRRGTLFTAISTLLCVVVALPSPSWAESCTISTVAGGYIGDGQSATSAVVRNPHGVARDAYGNLYIADYANNRIRKVDTAGVITTVAGQGGMPGNSGDGGQATLARLNGPTGVSVDPSGNIYIADNVNNIIRKVDTSGVITTVAGNALYGQYGGFFSGDGGPATSADLNNPLGVAVDASGNIFIADTSNRRIRKVDTSGVITTVAGNGRPDCSGDGGPASAAAITLPFHVALDASGNLYISDAMCNTIRKVNALGVITTVAGGGAPVAGLGDGGPATSANLAAPNGLAVDAAGNIFIADSQHQRIRKVDTTSVITTVAGSGAEGFSGDGGQAVAASFVNPTDVIVDPAGRLYITDFWNNRVRMVDISGVITTIAGGYSDEGAQAAAASLYQPNGVAIDAAGALFVADSKNNRIVKIAASGGVATLAGAGLAAGYSGDNGPATSARLSSPAGVAVDASGDVLIADTGNYRIRKVDTSGVITTVAGSGGSGYSVDGGPATAASLQGPTGVALDAAGNIYIAESAGSRVRKVEGNGVISTAASLLSHPHGVSVDPAGNLLIADSGNSRVKKVDTLGVMTTMAGNGSSSGPSGDGGPATSASLWYPTGVAADAFGNFYIAERSGNRIRTVNAGIITTITGTTTAGFSGDGGPAASGLLSFPAGVAVDASGNVYIADTMNDRIRKVSCSSNSVYTVTPLAGNGGSISPGTAQAVVSGATATFTVTPYPGYYLASVSGCGGILAGATYTTGEIRGDCTVTATFSASIHRLDVSVTGSGTILSSPVGIDCGAACSASFAHGTSVILSAYPSAGYTFAGWSGDPDCFDGAVLMTGPKVCSASFVDNTPPTIVITSPVSGTTNNSRPQLLYAVSDGTVVVKVDGAVVAKVSGNTLDPLADGTHKVRVEATDAAGNTGFAEVTFTVDTIAPTVSITSPAAGPTNNKTPYLNYTVSDGTVVVKVDGVVVNKASGSTLDPLVDGTHTVRVEATDAAGNTGAAEVIFTVDTVPPTVSINPVKSPTRDTTVTISGTRENGATVTVTVDTVAVAGPISYNTATTWSCTISQMIRGMNTVTAAARDAAGNTASVSRSIKVTK